jgi:uncharacterized membrane protein HdeD (DUF308 family)
MSVPQTGPVGPRETLTEAAGVWWLFLCTGLAWLLFGIVILRFDWVSVSSISILFGIFIIAVGINELMAMARAPGWWKVAHGLFAAACVVIGIVAFVHPGNTFAALAGVFSFFLIFKGFFDIVLALAARDVELWWLRLIAGFAQLALGFWAAGDFGHKTILLIVWVGLAAFFHGIGQILFAFSLRGAEKALTPKAA